MSPPPFITVVMPVRDEASFLERSLGAVRAQEYPPDRIEILVVDGMSTDGTREIVQRIAADDPRVRLLDNPSGRTPCALNIGMRAARGELIARVDGHCEIGPAHLRHAAELLASGTWAGTGGPWITLGETPKARAIAAAMSSPFGVGGAAFRTRHERVEDADTVPFPVYTRSAVEAAGLYDEELLRDQDDEYNHRLRALGGRLLLDPRLTSRYWSRSTLSRLLRQYFQYGLYKVRVLQKHPRQMQLRQFVPPAAAALGLGLLAAAPWWPGAGPTLGALAALYLLLTAGATAGAIRRRGRRASTAAAEAAERGSQRLSLPVLFLAFPALHAGYGIGFLAGLVRFWNRWGDRQGKVPPTGTPSATDGPTGSPGVGAGLGPRQEGRSPSHDRTSLLLAAADGDPSALGEVLADPGLVEAAVAHRLAPALALRLDEGGRGTEIPSPWREALRGSVAGHSAADRILDATAAALAGAGVAWAPIKGADLATRLYARPEDRPLGDVDLLVHEADARAARDAFLAAGFAPIWTGARHDRYLREEGYAWTARAPGAGLLEVHHRLWGSAPAGLGDRLLDAASPAAELGLTARRLLVGDALLVAAFHLWLDPPPRPAGMLREIGRLAAAAETGLRQAVERAGDEGLELPLALALTAAGHRAGSSAVTAAVDRLRPRLRAVERRLLRRCERSGADSVSTGAVVLARLLSRRPSRLGWRSTWRRLWAHPGVVERETPEGAAWARRRLSHLAATLNLRRARRILRPDRSRAKRRADHPR